MSGYIRRFGGWQTTFRISTTPITAGGAGCKIPLARPHCGSRPKIRHITGASLLSSAESSCGLQSQTATPILRGAPIAHIFTTGAKSAQLYRKLIEPRLTEAGIAIGMTQLPSTSPANASMRLPDLITAYREAFQKANVLENAYWKN